MYHLRCIHSFVLSLLGIAARAWRAPSRSIRRTAQASLTEEQKKLLCPLPSLPFLHSICASVLSFPSPSFLFPLFRFRPATAPPRDQPTPPPFTPDQPRVRPPPSDPPPLPPTSSYLLLEASTPPGPPPEPNVSHFFPCTLRCEEESRARAAAPPQLCTCCCFPRRRLWHVSRMCGWTSGGTLE